MVGDKVLIRRKKTTTQSPFDPDPFTVIRVEGNRITGERRQEKKTRNVDRWKKLQPKPQFMEQGKSQPAREDRHEDEDDDWWILWGTEANKKQEDDSEQEPRNEENTRQEGEERREPDGKITEPRVEQELNEKAQDTRGTPSPRARRRIQSAAKQRKTVEPTKIKERWVVAKRKRGI